MVQESTRCGHQDVHTIGQSLGLGGAIAAPHDEPERVHVVRDELLQYTVGLHGQLTGGREDHHTSAWGRPQVDKHSQGEWMNLHKVSL